MNWQKVFYLDKFGKAFIPERARPYIKEYFLKAGYEEVKYTWVGIMFWISAAITYFVYLPLVFPQINDLNPLLFFVWTFISWASIHAVVAGMLAFILYFHLYLRIYKRTQQIEDKLPDYLNLVSVNLKGGMSFEKSLWTAIKPEFKVLAKEITIVSKSVMTGNDVKNALRKFSRKYNSPILRRAIDLLVGEIEGGGRIVDVIDNIVENLKKTEKLKKELRVATRTYMIFISVIVIFIAPALFAVSQQLLTMITSFTANLSGSLQSVSTPFQFGGSNVEPADFKNFSYLALGIISTFSSMIVSIIDKGDIKTGLKYIPIYVSASLIMFTIFSAAMTGIFSGFTTL